LSRLLIVLLVAALLPGCATLKRGTEPQVIEVTTEPDGAVCRVVRDGDEVALIGDTPGRANVTRAYSALALSCRKDGYLDADITVESGVNPDEAHSMALATVTTFSATATGVSVTSTVLATMMSAGAAATGGLLLAIGGAIGFIVDAITGAMFDYPTSIALTLVPREFPTEAARDAFFAREEERLRTLATQERIKVQEDECTGPRSRSPRCLNDTAAVEEALDRKLASLARLRERTTVAPPGPAAGG